MTVESDIQYLLNRREFKTKFVGPKKSGAIFSRISTDVQKALLRKIVESAANVVVINDILDDDGVDRFISYNSSVAEKKNDEYFLKKHIIDEVKTLVARFTSVKDSVADFYEDSSSEKALQYGHVLTQQMYDDDKERWKKHIKSVDPEFDDIIEDDYIIPNEGLGYLQFLYNLSISTDAKYLYNDDITHSEKIRLKMNSLQHVTVKVVGELPINERLSIKGEVMCPQCRKPSAFYYCELNGDKFRCKNEHIGEICAYNLSWKNAEVTTSKQLYFYQCMMTSEEGKEFGTMKLCSSLCKLMPGIHKVQLLVRNLSEGGILILSKDFYDVDQQETFLTFDKDTDYEIFLRDRGLWHHNLFFINYRIRKLLREKAKIAIKDDSSIIALSMISQAFDRIYGDKIAGESGMIHLMAIADSGTGKSFISMLYGGVLFPRFLYVENSLRMSMPGMTGGMQEIFVGDRNKKLFTYGLFSEHDYVVFNEVTDRLGTRDGDNIANFFKAILDAKQASANVMGGRPVPREASVCLIGNIPNKDVVEYSREIRKEYQEVYNEKDALGQPIERYDPKWPLNVRMMRFKSINQDLYNVHDTIREDFVLNQERDFAVDIGVPLLRRFPFYYRVEKRANNGREEFTLNREAHLTKSNKDINTFIDANKVRKELIDEFPFMPIDEKSREHIYDFIEEVYKDSGIRKRKFTADVFYRIIRIFMCINKEKELSEETKKLFNMLIVEPSMDYISIDQYDCVRKRLDLEEKELEIAEEKIKKSEEIKQKSQDLSSFNEEDI